MLSKINSKFSRYFSKLRRGFRLSFPQFCYFVLKVFQNFPKIIQESFQNLSYSFMF